MLQSTIRSFNTIARLASLIYYTRIDTLSEVMHQGRAAMRALIIARTRTAPPTEMMPMLAQGFKDWRAQFRDQLEHFSWFTNGSGGCAIANVVSEMELFQMMVSWPLTPFSDVETHTLVNGDEALEFWAEMIQSMAGGQ
jgi:hypothetical protein